MFPILDLAIVGLGLLASGPVAQEYERGVVFTTPRPLPWSARTWFVWIIPTALERSITSLQRHVSLRSINP